MASIRVCATCGRPGDEESSSFCPVDGGHLLETESLARLGMRLRDYELQAVLGEGGMGTVYRALHVVLEKPVAVKVLRDELASRPELVEQFLTEAKAASRIRHPNIVDVTDFGITDSGLVFLVMEYLEGESLHARLRRVGRLAVFEAVGIVNQIARALSVAHQMNVVHRDLKPENVFLDTREGRRRVVERQSGAVESFAVKDEGTFDFVKVVDFGVAKLLDRGPGRNTLAGMVLGSPYYLSPEQARARPVDGRSDIYSLGAMFYEMVTGRVPFEGASLLDVLALHLSSKAIPPSLRAPDAAIDAGTDETIMRCLEKRPEDRFQSMDDLCDALMGCFTNRIFLRDAHRMPGVAEAGIDLPAPRSAGNAKRELGATPARKGDELESTMALRPSRRGGWRRLWLAPVALAVALLAGWTLQAHARRTKETATAPPALASKPPTPAATAPRPAAPPAQAEARAPAPVLAPKAEPVAPTGLPARTARTARKVPRPSANLDKTMNPFE